MKNTNYFVFIIKIYNYKNLFDYIIIDDLPKIYQKSFTKWMCGQTCPLIEYKVKLNKNKNILKNSLNIHDKKYYMNAVYFHDFLRWYENMIYKIPTYFD